MIIERFNFKGQDALERASRLAVKHEHRFVTPWHLMLGMLQQESSLAEKLLAEAGIDVKALTLKVEGELMAQPKAAASTQQTPVNRELERVFIHAEEASTAL